MITPKRGAFFARIFVYAGTVFTLAILLLIIGYILFKGVPNLSLDLFAWEYNSENVSLMPALINTILMTVLSLLIAAPLGIFAAIYLSEYAKRGNRLVGVVRITAETLSGIPSIIYGLFGLLFFVTSLGLGMSLVSGALTVSIMILPLIMRTTEESLIAVPNEYREGSFGLGAGRLRTVFKVVIPSAIPGILAGIILGTGRIVGETAALIYTAGTVAQVPQSIFDSTRTLSVHMYALASEGLYTNQAYATAAVLLVMVAGINALSVYLAKSIARRQHGKV
jgi:phosphate transport system permease protein